MLSSPIVVLLTHVALISVRCCRTPGSSRASRPRRSQGASTPSAENSDTKVYVSVQSLTQKTAL